MRILVACERFGRVRDAFRRMGHEAWSCDILPDAEGSRHHIQDDIHALIYGGGLQRWKWEMMLAFPPCTHLASSGARWFKDKELDGRQYGAIQLFMDIVRADIGKVAIENPIGIMSTRWRKPDQIIQPWMFGHGETKATCLWLKGLPKLRPTNIVSEREQRIWKMAPSPERAAERGKTYQGIAEAMAEQWGTHV